MLREPREKSNFLSTKREKLNKWWSNRNRLKMTIKKTYNQEVSISFLQDHSQLRATNKWTIRLQRKQTRMHSFSLKSTDLILKEYNSNQGQETELSTSIILQTISLWISKSNRKRKNLKKRQQIVRVLLHHLCSVNVILEVSVAHHLQHQVNTIHSVSQILSWVEALWCLKCKWWILSQLKGILVSIQWCISNSTNAIAYSVYLNSII